MTKVTAATRVKTNVHGKYAQVMMQHCVDFIKEKMEAKELNPNIVATGIGIAAGTVYRFMNKELNSSQMVFLQICSYLRMKPSEVYAEAEKRVQKQTEDFLSQAKKSPTTS